MHFFEKTPFSNIKITRSTVKENSEIFTKYFYRSQDNIHQISALGSDCFYVFRIFQKCVIFNDYFLKIVKKCSGKGVQLVYTLGKKLNKIRKILFCVNTLLWGGNMSFNCHLSVIIIWNIKIEKLIHVILVYSTNKCGYSLSPLRSYYFLSIIALISNYWVNVVHFYKYSIHQILALGSDCLCIFRIFEKYIYIWSF